MQVDISQFGWQTALLGPLSTPSGSGNSLAHTVALSPQRVLVIDPLRTLRDSLGAALTATSPACQTPQMAAPVAHVDRTGAPTPEIISVDDFDVAEEWIVRGQNRSEAVFVVFVHVLSDRVYDSLLGVRRLWQLDSDLQVVLCSDCHQQLESLLGQLIGETDRLLLLRLPMAAIEARQTLAALRWKWHSAREARRGIQSLLKIVENQTQEVVATRDLSMFALAKLAESRDPETGEHLERMREYSQRLAEHLSRESPYADLIDDQFLQNLYRSTPLHDIGKVGIPDAILLKPGKLTAEEFEVMKRHTLIGAATLEDVARHSTSGSFLRMATDIARYHHERFNGAGYPHGLRGEEIPLAARIVAVADVFDALTSPRVYKSAMDPEKARQMIEAESGKHFDPVVVEAFRACYPQFLQIVPRPASQLATDPMI